MKRLLVILLLTLVGLELVGCGAKIEQASTATPLIVSEPAEPTANSATSPATTMATATPESAPTEATPEPTAPIQTSTPTATSTFTPSPTTTPSSTPSATPTATLTPTATPTMTASEAAYANVTPTPGVTLFQTCMLNPDCTPPPAPPVQRLQKTENILLLGTDLRSGWDAWRTDTIMLVSIDHETNQIAIVSFPRDLYVYDPHFGKRKINVLDFLGEEHGYNNKNFQVIKEVFGYNYGIPIDHVVRVHRGAFVDFVNAIGGVDVTLDCDLWEISPKDSGGYNVLYLPAGTHHLDGETALEFATFRYRTADWGRARRQQAVLAAIKNQALQLGLLSKAPEIWNIIKQYVSADIGFLDMLRLAKYGLNLDMSSIHSHVISNRELRYTNLPSSGAFVLFPRDENAIRDELENIFEYVPINVQATHPKGCPPPPDWAADYLASLTPTPAAQ